MDAEPTTPAPQPAAQASKAEPPKPAEKKSDEVSVARKSSPRSDSDPCYCKMMANFLHFELIPR
jgi:hypothetical protein